MGGFVPNQPTRPQDIPEFQEASPPPPEDELDALLRRVEEKKESKSQPKGEDQLDSVDVFRARLRQIYIPVFEELKDKYSDKNITLEMDADDFLGGGSGIKIKFIYSDMSMVLEGTVTRGGVAFYMVRASGESHGTVLGGPMLRIRNLSADDFRNFIVDHLSTLIREVLRLS